MTIAQMLIESDKIDSVLIPIVFVSGQPWN